MSLCNVSMDVMNEFKTYFSKMSYLPCKYDSIIFPIRKKQSSLVIIQISSEIYGGNDDLIRFD